MMARNGATCQATATRSARSPANWAVFALNRQALAYIAAVELGALLLTAVALAHTSFSADTATRFCVLLALAVAYAEAADRIERFKRYLGSDRIWSNHTSVWAVAAVLALPVGPAALLVAAVYAHLFLLGHRHRSVRPHRLLLTAAAMTLATLAATTVDLAIDRTHVLPAGPTEGVATLTAVVLFHGLELAIMVVGMHLVTRARLATLLPNRDTTGFETLTQLVGVVLAQFVMHSLWLCAVPLMLVGLLHRTSLVKELARAASTDAKTELLNAAAWRDGVQQALNDRRTTQSPAAVLLIDLDHFKRINDTHGHLVGDRVLAEVAGCLRRESRAGDLLGRFGGEEFVVFIHGSTPARASEAAERLRATVASLEASPGIRVTASIGLATTSRTDARRPTLDQLLEAADRALYAAKAAGRNRVSSDRSSALVAG